MRSHARIVIGRRGQRAQHPHSNRDAGGRGRIGCLCRVSAVDRALVSRHGGGRIGRARLVLAFGASRVVRREGAVRERGRARVVASVAPPTDGSAHLPLGGGGQGRRPRRRTDASRSSATTRVKRRSQPPQELAAFRRRLELLGIGPLAFHASYLIFWTSDVDFQKSVAVLAHELLQAYGAAFVNVHIGSRRGRVRCRGARVGTVARAFDLVGDAAPDSSRTRQAGIRHGGESPAPGWLDAIEPPGRRDLCAGSPDRGRISLRPPASMGRSTSSTRASASRASP